MNRWTIHEGAARDVLRTMADESVNCVVTSPPYWRLRDYGVDRQLGLERTPEEYVAELVDVFREVRRVLRDDGTLWLNLGDSYNGGAGPSSVLSSGAQTEQRPQLETGYSPRCRTLKPKDLVGIPWRVAFALQEDGWWLRSDIIWSKPNPMPESVRDRPTKAHEYLFLLSKSERYYFDSDAVAEPSVSDHPSGNGYVRTEQISRNGRGSAEPEHSLWLKPRWKPSPTRNIRTVWTIPMQPFPGSHFAVFPPALVEPCVKAGTSEEGCCADCGAPWERVVEGCEHDSDPVPCTVLDPFSGAGTTVMVALRLGRDAIGIELSPEYAAMSRQRIDQDCPLFNRSAP